MNLYKIYFCTSDLTINNISSYNHYPICIETNNETLKNHGYCYYVDIEKSGYPGNAHVFVNIDNYEKFSLSTIYRYYANYIIKSERDKKLNQLI